MRHPTEKLVFVFEAQKINLGKLYKCKNQGNKQTVKTLANLNRK
jgi:hypothetical protein